MKIPFFCYPHVFEIQKQALLETFADVASRGAFILQEEVRTFEERLAAYCGVRHVIGVGNATDGLELILSGLGIGTGDEVILPSHTFVASVGAITSTGAHPVFAEIGADHLLDETDIEHRVTDRSRVLMPVQLNGRTCQMDELNSIAAAHDLIVVEDSAQGLGSRFRGRMCGTFGTAGIYSFYPAKILGALGDAGAVVTNDDALAQDIRERRDHGRTGPTGEVHQWGRNSRMDNLQAAFLLVKFEAFASEIARRRTLAARYQDGLEHVEQLVLPPPPKVDEDHFDTFQNYEVEAEERDELRSFLHDQGVGTALAWGGKAVHQFEALGFSLQLPRTEQILRRSLLLPMNTSLADDDVDLVCDLIARFYASE